MLHRRFDPTRYPRTYRPWLPLRIAVGALGLLVFCGAVVMVMRQIGDLADQPSLVGLSSVLVTLAWGAAAFFFTVGQWRARLTLSADALELRNFWGTQRVLRKDILDHEFSTRAGLSLNASTLARTWRPAMPLEADEDMRAWFAGLPLSSERELARNKQAIAADVRLGATPAERLAAAARARAALAPICWVVFFVSAWAALYPIPRALALALCAACPWLLAGLCWRSNGLFRLSINPYSGRGELLAPYLLPILGLGLRATTDVMLADGTTFFLWSVVATLLLSALLFAMCRDLRRAAASRKLMHVTLMLAYAMSLLMLVNHDFDATPGIGQSATVTARHLSGRKARIPYLRLAPTPADMSSPEIEVSRNLYEQTPVGGQVCLVEHDGALGWHWIEVRRIDSLVAHSLAAERGPATAAPTRRAWSDTAPCPSA